MKRGFKTKLSVGVIALSILATSMSAFAGTTYGSFSFNLPGFNSSKFTSYQTKNTIGATGEIDNYYTGANANVDARMIDDNGHNGKWTRNLNQNASYYTMSGHNSHTSGTKVKTEFSSDITTTVGVNISGDWRSN